MSGIVIFRYNYDSDIRDVGNGFGKAMGGELRFLIVTELLIRKEHFPDSMVHCNITSFTASAARTQYATSFRVAIRPDILT